MKTVVMYTVFSYGKQNPTGGTNRYFELIYGLIEKGNIVHLFIPKDAELRNDNHLIRHDIKRCSINSFLVPNGLLNFLVNFGTFFSIHKINYDAIISFDVPCSIQLSLLKLKKIFVFIRQDFIGYRKISIGSENLIKKFYLAVLQQIERTVFLRAHRIIVQCKYDKDILVKRHKKFKGLINSKMFILNNNVNPSWVTSKKYFYDKKKTNKNIRVCFVGNLDDLRKGLSLLLEAIAILLEEGKNLSLDVIGDGQLLEYYKNQYKNYANIRFIGNLKNPLPAINECNLMVVPSLADSFPNTIMEAFYLGLPVVGSDVGGIPEMLRYDELTFPHNVTGLVAKLRDIIHHDKLELYREYSRKRKKELTFDWVERVCDLI